MVDYLPMVNLEGGALLFLSDVLVFLFPCESVL